MALVVFDSRVNIAIAATPSVGGFIIGYDSSDGILKQKDHLGVISKISGSSSIGSLNQTLGIGNNTGTYSIFLDPSSAIKSELGNAQLKLTDSIGSGGVGIGIVNLFTKSDLTESYLSMNDNSTTLKSLTSKLVLATASVILEYNAANTTLLTQNYYTLSLNSRKVLEFTTATSSSGNTDKISGIISSKDSYFSTVVNNSLILGGTSIVGNLSNTVYVPNLYVKDGGLIKGTLGNVDLKFTSLNEIILDNHGSYQSGSVGRFAIISSSGSYTGSNETNGIIMVDNLNDFTSPDAYVGTIFIGAMNAGNTIGVANSIVIGGDGLQSTQSNTIYLGGNININNEYNLPLSDGLTGQNLQTDGSGNLSWVNGSTALIPITATDFYNLNGIYDSGVTYQITDADINLYGGTEIYLTTNSAGVLNDKGVGKFYNPKYYDYNLDEGYSVYDTTYSVGQNEFYIWGGYLWTNLYGSNSLPPADIFNLDTDEWQRIEFNDTFSLSYYNISYDEIKYDWLNDIITYRNEKNTNIVSTSKSNILYWNDLIGYNPIKAFQWGNIYDFNTYRGIGSQNIINSYNENINFRGTYQFNITMNNLSGQYNLPSSTTISQESITFDNFIYDRQSISFASESGLVFQGDLPNATSSKIMGKVNNQQVEIDLAATSLVTPVITSRWNIFMSNGTTPFGPTVIDVVTVGTFSTSNSVTVPIGCKVSYTGTSSIPAATTGFSTPTTRTGNFIFIGSIYPVVSATLSTTGLSASTIYTTTITKSKTGLIVSGSQVIAATGSDSLSVSTQITFSNLFYFGYLVIGPISSNISQVVVDGLTESQIEGLCNYKFGGRAQTFVANDEGSGSRLIFAYPSSLGLLTTLTYTGSTVNSLGAFTRRANPLTITTISGLSISYHVYVANADDTWGNGTTPVTITTT